jgi:hypothetical protein
LVRPRQETAVSTALFLPPGEEIGHPPKRADKEDDEQPQYLVVATHPPLRPVEVYDAINHHTQVDEQQRQESE